MAPALLFQEELAFRTPRMTARPSLEINRPPHEVAIMGNDLLLRALPAQAIQVAHAVAASGFELAVPVSWGEELVAEAALQHLAHEGSAAGAQVFCCCPRVRARLLAPGPELAPHLLSLVAPPVALARYLREHAAGANLRITFIGACDGARDPSLDRQVHPADFLRDLAAAGIDLMAQPTTFSDVLPPDRRRHWSLPGGCPAPEVLREHTALDDVTFLPGPEVAHDIVDAILRGDPVLLDVAAPLSCACAGAISLDGVIGSRQAIVSREPPRARTPIIEGEGTMQLEHRIPPSPGYTPPPPLQGAELAEGDTAPRRVADVVVDGDSANRTGDAAAVLVEVPVHVPLSRRPIAVTPPGVALQAAGEEPVALRASPVEDKPSTAGVAEPARATSRAIAEPHVERRRWRRRHGGAPRVTPAGGATIPRAFAALRDRHVHIAAPLETQSSPPEDAIPELAAPPEMPIVPAPVVEGTTEPLSVRAGGALPAATHTVGVVPPVPSSPERTAPRMIRPRERSRRWPTILFFVVLSLLIYVIMRLLRT